VTHLLGIDLGTSSVKVALFDAETLSVLASTDREYPVYHPQPGLAEQNPQDWWEAVVYAVQAVLKQYPSQEIRGIGLSGQMHGMVCLGQNLKPKHPAIIWADTRSTTQVKDLEAFQKTIPAALPGLPATGFAASTTLWLSQNRPEILTQTHQWLLPKDYIRLQLTGLVGTDPSDAASTWFYDVVAGDWTWDVVAHCGLSPSQMPLLQPSSAFFGELTAQAAEALGLRPGIPVVTGCADLPAQALGHGIVEPGTTLITVGTGGQVFVPLSQPQVDSQHRYYVFDHNIQGHWYAQAAILAAGLALNWLRTLLGLDQREDAYAYLSELAESVPLGAEGLLFLPYLAGERSPHMDSKAAGLLLGLRLHHEPGHMARAVMEGVCFALKDCLTLVNVTSERVVLSGGITKSSVWPQILADVLGKPLHVANTNVPYGCIGAVLLAGMGTGIYPTLSDGLSQLPQPERIVQPQIENLYQERYEQYKRLYPILKEEMHLLT
jgi:xylulokinase